MIKLKIGKFALNKSVHDERDHVYKQSQSEIRQVVDLKEWASPVQDQLDLSSCVAAALTDAYELRVKKLYPETFTELSKLFVYYNARLLEGLTGYDDGTTLRTALKGAAHFGICSEDLWPYNYSNLHIKPTPICYRDGSYRVIPKYERLNDLHAMLAAINDEYSVIVGLEIYEDFISLNSTNYTVAMPEYNSKKLGLHAMSIVGYDLDTKMVIAKNSFGKDWGLDGYCQIPFHYVQNNFFEQWKFDIATPEIASVDYFREEP